MLQTTFSLVYSPTLHRQNRPQTLSRFCASAGGRHGPRELIVLNRGLEELNYLEASKFLLVALKVLSLDMMAASNVHKPRVNSKHEAALEA
jgi:hypothetical protein